MEKKLEVELKGVPLTDRQTDVLMPLLVQHMQRRMKRSKFEARAVAMLAGAGCPLVVRFEKPDLEAQLPALKAAGVEVKP